MWYINIMDYYSAISRNEVRIKATTQVNFENILSRRNEPQGHVPCDSMYMQLPERQSHRDRTVVSRDRREGEESGEFPPLGPGFFWGVVQMLWDRVAVMTTQRYEYTKHR